MTSPSKLRQIGEKVGVTVDIEREGNVYSAFAWSPDGKVFRSNGGHCYALEANGYYTTPDWNKTKLDLEELIAFGFDDCTETECDNCTPRSAKHIGFAEAPDGTVYEFYVIGSDIHRAPVDSPVMPSGSRSGRFEYPNRADFRGYLASVWKADFSNGEQYERNS